MRRTERRRRRSNVPLSDAGAVETHTATLNELRWDAGEWSILQINSNWHIHEEQ
jgi:hypothetical protein